MEEKRILGVVITDRQKEAGEVQKVLTKYGCSIKTRLGLHEASTENCSNEGLILLELIGDYKDMDNLEEALQKIEGTETQKMSFRM